MTHASKRIVRITTAATIGAILILSSAPSWSQTPGQQVAQVKTASGKVTVLRNGASSSIKAGDPLYEKDVLQTEAGGSVGITFTDNTVMSVGPNSEVALDDYAFDSSNFKGAMVTNVHKGTLSMISGDIAKSSPGAMKVRTPEAMLGVRGTRFAVQVAGQQ